MEGDGPTGGRRRHVGLTAAARYDGLYALDLVLAGLIGLGPDRVPMLAEAVRRGLCPVRGRSGRRSASPDRNGTSATSGRRRAR